MKKAASRFLAMVLALCLVLSLMPAVLARDVEVPELEQYLDLDLELRYASNGQYQARYVATLRVSDQFAQAVAVYHDKEKVLDDLVFTCLLTGDLIDLLTGDENLDFTFESPLGVFLPAEGYDNTEEGLLSARLVTEEEGSVVETAFMLNPEKDAEWRTAPAATVKKELQSPVTVTSDWLPFSREDVIRIAGDKRLIHSVERVDISRKSGRGVPLYGVSTVENAAYTSIATPVLLGALTLNITGDGISVGSVDRVDVTLSDGAKEYTLTANWTDDGRWTCVFSDLPYGVYNVTVTATMEDGGIVQCMKDCAVDAPEVTVPAELSVTYLSTEVSGNVAADNLENAISDSEKEKDIVPPEEGKDNLRTVDLVLTADALTEDSVIYGENGDEIAAKVVMDSINDAGAGYDLYGGGFVDFVDVVLTKRVQEWTKEEDGKWKKTAETENPIHNAAGLVTMSFPISDSLRGAITAANALKEEGDPEVTVENIVVFRLHDNDIQPMRKVSASNGQNADYECCYISTLGGADGIGAEYITIKANRFSVYAFGVSMTPVEEYTPAYVTFESNGGSEVYVRGAVEGSVLQLEEIVPQREGYLFTGWYTDPELTNRVTSVTVYGDMTLYAGWQKCVADPNETGVAKLLNTDDHFGYVYGVPGGLFLPDAHVTRKEVAQMFYNVLRDKTIFAPDFPDVPADAWYADAVGTLAELGVFLGSDDGRFEPDRSITRAEFTTAAMRFASLNPGGENIFTDLEEGSWYYDKVLGAVTYGWIEGRGGGIFDPGGLLTRAEAVTIINRMLCRSGDRGYIHSHAEDLVTFSDVPAAHWAYYNIEEAANTHDYSRAAGETWS